MSAVNMHPFSWSRSKDNQPHKFRGLVQAGGTQAIKRGEIICFNKTAGYWIPVSAVNDYIYALAISAEEQKAADSARYIEMYSLHPDDVWEFPIAAARSLALGNGFTLTASDSQKLTYSATANGVVANQVFDGHYPETGTTIRNRSSAQVTFDPRFTAWGLLIAKSHWGKEKWINSATPLTLYEEMSGLCISNIGDADGAIHVLPQTPRAGTWFKAYAAAAQDHGFAPGAAGAVYIEGNKQADDKDVSVDAIGDSLKVTADGNGDWLGEAIISSAADATGAIDVEAG